MFENGQMKKSNRCTVCDSKTLIDVEVTGEDLQSNLSKADIVKTGGKCPRCDAQIFKRNSDTGNEFYQTSESPLHSNLSLLAAGAFALDTDGKPKLEETIGKGRATSRCDVVIDVPGHEDEEWNGLAIEIVVDNSLNIERKKRIYRENGYTPICVYPKDAVNIFNTDKILSRELQ